MLLERNRTFDTGANLIARYSGRRPTLLTEQRLPTPRRPPALQLSQRSRNNLSPAVGSSHSPGRSPARFLSPQKGLETLFQEVSGTLQKRTEGWKVPKAVREVVGEVRRNMNSNFQSGTASPRKSLDAPHSPRSQQSAGQETMAILRRRLSTIETRNRALAKMLGDAIEELRTQKQTPEERRANMAEESFNMALAKMQFVQVYLSDTDIPLPGENGLPIGDSPEGQSKEAEQVDTHQAISRTSSDELTAGNQREVAVADKPPTSPRTLGLVYESRPRTVTTGAGLATQDEKGHTTSVKQFSKSSPQARPPLAQSPLSWMLGEGHHRSEFVSSSTAPPEQRRESTSIPKPKSKRLFADGKTTEGRDDSDTEDDGFTLSSLHGSQSQN